MARLVGIGTGRGRLILTVALLGSACGRGEPAQVAAGRSPAELRAEYNAAVAQIPAFVASWEAEGLGLEEQARRAYAIRRQADINARNGLANPLVRVQTEHRNRVKYGDPNGPHFEDRVAELEAEGLAGEAIHAQILAESAAPRAKRSAKFPRAGGAQGPERGSQK